MNSRNIAPGLLALFGLCVAIVFQFLYLNPWLVYGAWGITAFSAAYWIFLHTSGIVEFFTRKSTHYGANVALIIFLVLGCLVFLNVLAKENSWRKDVTRARTNTLSEQTTKILSELNQEVKAFFFSNLGDKEKGEDLLKRYAHFTKKFQYEFVDMVRRPTMVQTMGVKGPGSVVLTLGEAKRVVLDDSSEETVTNGLVKLLHSNDVAVYFTNGHDEFPLGGDNNSAALSQLQNYLTKQGYTVKELSLLTEGKIPADAAMVIVAGPKKAFLPKELEILSGWVKGGGRAIFTMTLDVNESGLAKGSRQIAEILKPYGVEVRNEMLVDPTSKLANVEPQILIGFSGGRNHPITRDFVMAANAVNFLFPLTTYLQKSPGEFEIQSLAVTSDRAWAESDWNSIRGGKVTFNQGADRMGRMDLGYAVEAKTPEGKEKAPAHSPRFVVFADTFFMTNGSFSQVSNRDLILNTVSWLSDDERFISIRVREDPDQLRQFDDKTVNLILFICIFLTPLAALMVGMNVYWRRAKL
ncbi:MAG TPA: Gldg family protein [Bdellovibrionota bacterium]